MITCKVKQVGQSHTQNECRVPVFGSQPQTRRYTAITFRQARGHLPSCRASPTIGWYQIILLGDRTEERVQTTCSGLHSTAGWLGLPVSPAHNHSATEPHFDSDRQYMALTMHDSCTLRRSHRSVFQPLKPSFGRC